MPSVHLVVALGLSLTLAGSALAQSAAKSTPPASPSIDPATVTVARDVVAQMQGDRATVLSAIAAPMVGMMQQIGVKEADRAQTLVQEVILPTLSAHYDELLDLQARSFAGVLSVEDLRGIGAFYASPAGKRLAAVQPQLAQAQLTGTQQWMQSVMPEIQGKLTKAMQDHGWVPGGAAKPR